MRRRLLSLDYVLDCPDLPWLPTEAEKLACFDGLGVPREALPRRVYRGAGKQAKRYFANKHPIAVDPGSKSAVFVYADSDEQTSQGLRRWRGEHAALWSRLCSRGFRLSVVHVSRNPEIAKFVEGLFATWSRSAGGAANAAELTRELRRLEAALEKDDDAVFDEYGGFSRALSRAGKLERRLKQKNELGGYEAGHSVWLSSRIRPKGAWRNVLGPHQVEVEEGDDDEA